MNKMEANNEVPWKGLNPTPHKLLTNYADLVYFQYVREGKQHAWGRGTVIIDVLIAGRHVKAD